MAKREGRLSWFRWFWQDFDSGTRLMTDAEVGQYVRLLHLQADSGDKQVIPSDSETLEHLMRGPVSPKVLAKFEPSGDGFRNQRLCDEWKKARSEYERKAAGGRVSQDTRKYPDKIQPEKRTEENRREEKRREEKRIPSKCSKPTKADREVRGMGGGEKDSDSIPDADRARLSQELLDLASQIADHVGLVTSQVVSQASNDRGRAKDLEGKVYAPVWNPKGMSPGRLLKTIENARSWLAEIKARNKPKPWEKK